MVSKMYCQVSHRAMMFALLLGFLVSLFIVALQRPLRARRVLALGAVVFLVHLLEVLLEMIALPRREGTLLATAFVPYRALK